MATRQAKLAIARIRGTAKGVVIAEAQLQARRILKDWVDATNYGDACDRIQNWANSGISCYVVAANVHVVMTAYLDPQYQRILDQAAMVTLDGMPLVVGLRMLGVWGQSRVYGPDLILA